MLTLANLMMPWEKVRKLETCRSCVRNAYAYFDEVLQDLMEPQQLPLSYFNQQVSNFINKFMGECTVSIPVFFSE